MKKKRVVVIGGGFGGINLIKKLKHAPLEILLIDKTNHHLFQPLLYQVATAALSASDIAIPLREIFSHQKNLSIIMGEVVHIDKGKKVVSLKNGEKIPYDYLVIAAGSRHSYFGSPDWEEKAPGLKTLRDALSIREKILIAYEKAERTPQKAPPSFIIIGAGPTGVEMAGAIAEIARNAMLKNFRHIEPEKTPILLIEGAERILPMYPPKLAKKGQRDLEKLGVRVLTNTKVLDIKEDGIETTRGFFSSYNIIWAAGNIASPLLTTLNTPLDLQGRAIVEKDLSLSSDPSIFVIGDAAHSLHDEAPLPSVAPVAIQQGQHVAKVLLADLYGHKRPPFRYFNKGSLATIGKGKALCLFRKWHFSGFFAWLLWTGVHIFYLIGFRNRFNVMMKWAFQYLTGARGSRLIYSPLDSQEILPQKEPLSKGPFPKGKGEA